jgi:hypothetical protein
LFYWLGATAIIRADRMVPKANHFPRKILNSEAEIACYTKPNGTVAAYLHMDLDATRDTIEQIRKAESQFGMHIVLAHDDSWIVD